MTRNVEKEEKPLTVLTDGVSYDKKCRKRRETLVVLTGGISYDKTC